MSMYDEPLQDPSQYCAKCNIISDYESSKLEIGDARFACAHCKQFGKYGIYKFDALRQAIHPKRPPLTPGKKAIISKRYGTAVLNLRSEGLSIRDIAETLGISTGSVQKILNEHKENK